MKKWLNRIMSLLLAVVMLLTLCACGATPEEPTDAYVPEESGSSQYSEDEIVTITILAQEYADPGYPRRWSQEGMALVRKIAYERFGLRLQLQEVIGGEDNFKAILNTQLAAGTDVPDVIRFDMDISELNQHYINGKILNLSDYEEYMPDIVATFEEIPSLKQAHCTYDGDILRIPTIAYNIQHVSNWANIRRDWLDELGMDAPTTTEEFREVLRAFQENDMNGNGKKDEVYVAGFEALNVVLSPAFGVKGMTEAADSWYVDENGKVYCSMLTDEAKAYVEYVASMFDEGLFWTEGFTDGGAQEMILINENARAGKIGAYGDSLLFNIDGKANGRPDEYNPMLPLSDGTHDAQIMIKNYEGHTTTFLTKDCPAPERVIAFYNWCYSEEASTILYLGDDPNNLKYYERVPLASQLTEEQAAILSKEVIEEMSMKLTPAGEELAARERNMTAYLGANNGLWPMKAINEPYEIAIDFAISYDEEATRSAGDLRMNYDYLNWPYEEGNSFMNISLATMTDEQYQVIQKNKDLFVYINEMYKKFMMGVEPMSNWDAFVEQCYNQGLGEVLDVMQQRYDALNP